MPRHFGGVSPELVEGFVERVELDGAGAGAIGATLDRWKALRADGWDVEALAGEWGGQVVELVGIGCRYLEAPELAASGGLR